VSTRPQKIRYLSLYYDRLGESRHKFVLSLIDQFHVKRELSEKQWFFVEQLCDDIFITYLGPLRVKIENARTLFTLFEKASATLSQPKMHIEAGDLRIKLTYFVTKDDIPNIYVDAAKYENLQGAKEYLQEELGVTHNAERYLEPDGEYLGKLFRDEYYVSSDRSLRSAQEEVILALRINCIDPERMASLYGKRTGKCCFCSLPLTDMRSTFIGYGEQCARNYGLHYPKKSEVV